MKKIILETDRLILRTWDTSDIQDYFDINQDPAVIQFLYGPLNMKQVQDFILAVNAHQDKHGFTLWAAEIKKTQQLIGFIGLNYTDWGGALFTPAVEIGWRLGLQYWNKGYATEGAKAALEFGFKKIGLNEIVSFTVPANIRSIRLMERIGLKRDFQGDFAHPKWPADHPLSLHVLYRLTKNEYNHQVESEKTYLSGGRVNHVVRIGNTVRRPLGKNFEYTHKLLQRLESVGFKGAPRFLGIDAKGREILSYIEGNVPPELGFWTDEQLIAAAKLIRQFHNAVSDILLSGNEEVVNHNDLSPCNTVMVNDLPIAFIDFDAAAPGSRVHDLAYAVWLWCDLGNEEIGSKEQTRRIKLFCDSYGLKSKGDFIAAIIARQQEAIDSYQQKVNEGLPGWQDAVNWGKHCLQWVIQNAGVLRLG